MARSIASRRRVGEVIVPGIHAAVVESYWAEAEAIDPRLSLGVEVEDVPDPAELRALNRQTPHSKSCRRIAERLSNGEVFGVSARRVKDRVPDAAQLGWLADVAPNVGVVVMPDDSIRRARPGESVYA